MRAAFLLLAVLACTAFAGKLIGLDAHGLQLVAVDPATGERQNLASVPMFLSFGFGIDNAHEYAVVLSVSEDGPMIDYHDTRSGKLLRKWVFPDGLQSLVEPHADRSQKGRILTLGNTQDTGASFLAVSTKEQTYDVIAQLKDVTVNVDTTGVDNNGKYYFTFGEANGQQWMVADPATQEVTEFPESEEEVDHVAYNPKSKSWFGILGLCVDGCSIVEFKLDDPTKPVAYVKKFDLPAGFDGQEMAFSFDPVNQIYYGFLTFTNSTSTPALSLKYEDGTYLMTAKVAAKKADVTFMQVEGAQLSGIFFDP